MKVAKACVRTIKIPFVVAFHHFLASRRTTESLVLEVIFESNIRGYGECTPRDYVSGETVESTANALKRCLKELRKVEFHNVADIRRCLDEMEQYPEIGLGKHPNARCALELALLDGVAKECSSSVAQLLGGLRTDTLHYSGVLSLDCSPTHTRMVEQVKMFGFRQVKIKVGRETERDLENVRLVRSRLGNDVEIRIDANGAWTLDEAVKNMRLYAALSITIVEQPLPAASRQDYPVLLKEMGTQAELIIDESLVGIEDALWFVDHRGASGFNLKVSKLGGLFKCLEILEVAERAGITCQLGCHVGETSILTAAGMILAGLCGKMRAHEGAFGGHLLSWDIAKRPLQFHQGGRVDLASCLQWSGLGIEVDQDLLEKSTGSGEWI
jgi:L-Ala-D/L-Glu epimerase